MAAEGDQEQTRARERAVSGGFGNSRGESQRTIILIINPLNLIVGSSGDRSSIDHLRFTNKQSVKIWPYKHCTHYLTTD